jgi:outer membrane protein
MKRLLTVVCVVLGLSVPAFAQKDFFDNFLKRYRTQAVSIPAFPGASNQNPLEALIRSGVLPLSIGDVINLTLQNNLDIGVNRLTPLSTQLLIGSYYGVFEPTIRLGATVNRNTSPALSQLSGASSLSQLTHNYTVGFGQSLDTGTTLGVDFTLTRSSSNSSFSTFNPSWTGTLRYSIGQHLLRDYGRSVNLHEIRIAQNNKQISDTQFELQVIDLVTQAQKTYWDFVFTAEDTNVKQRSLDLAKQTQTDNETQVRIGTLAEIDVIQAKAEVAARNEQLVISTHTAVQIEDRIKKLVSNQADPGLVLAKFSPSQAARRPMTGDVLSAVDAIRLAAENRPEVRQLELELKNRDIDVKYTKNQLLPLLDLAASFTQDGVGGVETLRSGFNGPIIAVNRGGFTDAFGQLFGYGYTGYSAGFNLQIPIRNRAQQATYARAVTEKQLAENRIAALLQQIALEVRNAITEVEMDKARIETAEAARDLAEQRLQAERKKFELGASTVRFVLEEQRNVTQAQTNEIAALTDYAKAMVDYEKALGVTLKNHNIEIEKTLSAAKGN